MNTLTSPELRRRQPAVQPGASTRRFDLGGFQYTGERDPYSGGCWDLVFTADDPYSRPDPYRGQLVPYAQHLRR